MSKLKTLSPVYRINAHSTKYTSTSVSYVHCLQISLNDNDNEMWYAKKRIRRICFSYNASMRYSMRHMYGGIVSVIYPGLYLKFMMTSSNGNIFRVAGHLCGEFTCPSEFRSERPVTRSFDVFFNQRLNKRLRKQPWCWWFETPQWSVWRRYNV